MYKRIVQYGNLIVLALLAFELFSTVLIQYSVATDLRFGMAYAFSVLDRRFILIDLALILVIVFLKKYTLQQWMILGALFSIFTYQYLFVDPTNFFKISLNAVLFLFALKDIELKTIFKTVIISELSAFVIIIGLFVIGLLPNTTQLGRLGVIRNGLGFANKNHMFILVNIVLAFYGTLKDNKKIITPILLFVITSFFYFQSYNRTAYLLLTILIGYWLIKNLFPKYTQLMNRLLLYGNRVFILLGPLLMYVSAYFYSPNSKLLSYMNVLLSGRIRMGHEYVINNTVNLLGNKLEFVNQFSSNFRGVELLLDSGFLRLIINFGVLITIIFIVYAWKLSTKLFNSKYSNLLIILFIELLFLITESYPFQMETSLLFVLGVVLFKEKTTSDDKLSGGS
ncbi:MAG: hypothetical protein LBT37_04610 [Lactobacillaceae bacterium]|jgi:hypothetical protein|nr:hypothetical protein [Lactobacillaceae bacterium]